MKKIIALTIICTAVLLGCGKKGKEPEPSPVTVTETSASIEEVTEVFAEIGEVTEESVTKESIAEEEIVQYTEEELMAMSPEELFEAYCRGEIKAAYRGYDGELRERDTSSYVFGDDYTDVLSHAEIKEPIDIDNDGEDEYVIERAYGDEFYDCKDGKVFMIAEGEGTAIRCKYAKYKDAMWVVHYGFTDGSGLYRLDKYDGDLNIVDTVEFGWHSDDTEEKNKNYYFNEKTISESEYNAMIDELFPEE